MTALKYRIRLNAGETSSLVFPVLDEHGLPVTITGWTGKAQIRSAPGIPAVLYEWSATNGNITVSGSSVTLRVAAADSAAWDWTSAFYDLILTDLSGNVYRIAEGNVQVDPAITSI
jgi:hypothetical protein